MNRGWRAHIVPLLAIAVSFVATVILLPRLPDPIPIHWNAAGQPDNYAPRFWGAFALPLTALGLYGLFLIIPTLDPRRENYAKFADTYQILRVLFVLFMVFIQGITLYSILVTDSQLNTNLVLIGVGLLLVVIGNYMPRVRHNWFVGVRTPWTLSNEEVWRRTHRLGGQVFVLGGIIIAASAFLPAEWGLVLMLAAIVLMALVPVGYSYWLYRKIQARQT